MEIEMGDADPKNLISLGRYTEEATGFLRPLYSGKRGQFFIPKKVNRRVGLVRCSLLTRCDRDQFRRLAHSLTHSLTPFLGARNYLTFMPLFSLLSEGGKEQEQDSANDWDVGSTTENCT